jgi:KaiC/GvpD/RAD55 family RecA-like ATPase
VIQSGVDYGANILVEFEPDSLWYEASFTISTRLLKDGIGVHYHTFIRSPKEVTTALARLGLETDKLQASGLFKIIDSYTVQVGLGSSEVSRDSPVIGTVTQSLKLADWSIGFAKEMKEGTGYVAERKVLHVDDSTSVLLQYNDERTFLDVWRTRALPHTRVSGQLFIYALLIGAGSNSLYKQLESLSDGIVDFRIQDTGGQIEHLMRVRTMRGRNIDSRWHRIQLLNNGEVSLVETS